MGTEFVSGPEEFVTGGTFVVFGVVNASPAAHRQWR